jgi:hypothetical protein
MERCRSASSIARTGRLPGDHSWLGVFVETIDKPLRRRLGVSEYTRSSDCFFRVQIARNTNDVRLADGTFVRTGDGVIDLHFWNEQVPVIPAAGPTLGWARRMNESFELSMRELARHLATCADMKDVVAIRLDAALGAPARSAQISRILSRFGFETISQEQPSLARRIHQYGENVLISLLVLAHNKLALRSDTLMRDRVIAYLSRQALERRYGASANTGNQGFCGRDRPAPRC